MKAAKNADAKGNGRKKAKAPSKAGKSKKAKAAPDAAPSSKRPSYNGNYDIFMKKKK